MRLFPVALALALAQASAMAGESMQAKLDAKRKQPFLSKAPWTTDYDKARESAKASDKPIFAYFTRSYAP